MSVAAGNAEGAVHGAVVIGVLFAAEDAVQVGYAETIAAAAVVLALYWLTSLYAYNLAARLRTRDSVNRGLFWRSCVHELTVIEGGFIPVLVVLVYWIAGASVTRGVTAAVGATAITIVVLELVAAWRTRLRPKRRLLQACAGVAMGLAIIALKLMLH